MPEIKLNRNESITIDFSLFDEYIITGLLRDSEHFEDKNGFAIIYHNLS